jgi:hypothetical protein
MDDLKKLSVERLRELARKHLGKGHSRLRTKAQLLEALRSALREPLARLREVAESVVPHAKSKVRVVDFPPGRKGRLRTDRAAPQVPAEAGSERPRQPESGTRRAEGGSGGAASKPSGRRRQPSTVPTSPSSNGAPVAAPGRSTRGDAPSPPPAPPPEVLVEEGFFEAPTTPRRARRAPARPEPVEPGPFASPREVGTDAPLLLVRDPTTLFVFWDFRRELERGAALGLREPRLLLRLHRGADLDRTLELPLTSRSTYVTGLTSGQEYTAEVLLLGRDGWTRPVGSRSAARRLPPGRVSAQLEVRTLRLPWSEPLSERPLPSAPSAPRLEPLESPRRVPLPTSPGARGPGDTSGGGGPRSGKN